ncbi:MAG: glycosyltransferase [Methanobacterium sp. Maddingley MBC34]|nr:MAG: glycosyltransferase [Methanobacterium sp. Maddingley MBC34]
MGGGARLKDIAQILGELGFSLNLICYLSDSTYNLKRFNHDYKDVTEFHVPEDWRRILKALIIFYILYEGIKKIRGTDVILSHSTSVTTGLPALLLSKIFRKPLIVDYIDLKDDDTPLFIHNMVLKNSKKIMTISHYLKREVDREYLDKSCYIPIFIDSNLFQFKEESRKEVRECLGIGDEILVGYAGSFWYVEGVPILLRVFNHLKQIFPLKLLLLGGANVKGSDDVTGLIKKMSLGKDVIILPPQPREKIPDYLSACDILCSPKIDNKINEAANPVKIYEYLSMGLTTVASSVGEVSNLIENGRNGFLFKAGNEKELEKVMEKLILDPELRALVGKRGRDTIYNHYRRELYQDKIKCLLEESMGE